MLRDLLPIAMQQRKKRGEIFHLPYEGRFQLKAFPFNIKMEINIKEQHPLSLMTFRHGNCST